MIRHLEIPGGGGGDCIPDGRYISNMRDGSALRITGDNRIECPPGSNVLYPRIPPRGEFKIIGQCSTDGCKSTYEWRAGIGWTDVGWSVGVSPAIYDYDGKLYLVTPGGPWDTQGFRYVEPPTQTFSGGRVVTGNATQAAAPDGVLIHEYSKFAGDYYGGQGHDEGTHIVTPVGARYILSHGDNRFTRWTYDPSRDVLAVAVSNLTRKSVEFWWLSLADILTLEPFTPPVEHPLIGITDGQFASLQTYRTQYPQTMTPIQTGDMLNRWTYDWRNDGLGMQVDSSDPHALHPDGTPIWTGVRGRDPDGREYGQDVLIGASVGQCTPSKSAPAVAIKPGDPAFKAPTKPDSGGGGGGGGDLESRVKTLEEQMAMLQARVERHLKP
jgi:hypothetical protein